MDRPTLRQLSYLVAVDEHRHFGKAAEACFVSQPALSGQIRELERRLGVTLFERGNRKVLPTAVGTAVIERARGVLRDTDELVAAAHPLVELHLHELKTAEILRQLRDGGLDLGLLALPVAGDDLVAVALAEDPFVLALPEGHPLAGAGPVDIDVVAGLPVILLEEGHCLRDQALSVCRLVGTDAAEMQATGMPTLCQMVATGRGVTLLPASAVALEARPGTGLTTRPFTDPAPTRTVGLVWRRTSPNGTLYRELGLLLTNVLAGPADTRPVRRTGAASRGALSA